MKKIVFYYTHRESLGHTTRILSLIYALLSKYKKQVKIFVIQGGKPQEYLKHFPEIEWFNLPYPYYSRLDFKRNINKLNPLYIKIRLKHILDKVKKIKPHIFITEFFPFGRLECKYELLPVLNFLKEKKIKIYASVGYPYIVFNAIKLLLECYKLYDKILIHTPEDIETNAFIKNVKNANFRKLYQQIFKKLKDKIIYTGYILPFNFPLKCDEVKKIRKLFNAEDKTLILVSRGGGVTHPKIISSSILAKKYLSRDYVFLVILGPASSEREIALFNKLIEKLKNNQIFIKKYTPNFCKFLYTADISVSMAGYNTSIQLLYLKKKSILIPSTLPERGYGCNEQIARAYLLKKYINSSVLEYNTLTPKKLVYQIQKKNKECLKCKKINKEWFKGGEISADFLMGS